MPINDCATLHQLNVSPGGVPKTAVDEAYLTTLGLRGDKQKHTRFHGGVMRAVCLYSLELITELQREGHPIQAGTTGENLTLCGIDWSELLPGVRLALGDEAAIEIASYTAPCNQIAASFKNKNFNRISQKHFPGWSRLYARVIVEGFLRTGQSVKLIS